MIRRVILHAGFHKTGTSHVQRTLRANARALAPYATLKLKRDMKPLMQAARSFSSLRDVGGLMNVTAAFNALLNEVPETACLVIAAEELSGHMPGRPQVPDYGTAPTLAELYANAIRARWPKAQIVFHYGTRRPREWLHSAYWEHVKSSSMTMDIEEFCARHTLAARLDAVVDQVAALGLAVQRTPLEQATGKFGPAKTVLDLCDLPQGLNLIPQAPHNTRPPQPVLLDLLAANRAYPERAALTAAKAAILAKAGL